MNFNKDNIEVIPADNPKDIHLGFKCLQFTGDEIVEVNTWKLVKILYILCEIDCGETIKNKEELQKLMEYLVDIIFHPESK